MDVLFGGRLLSKHNKAIVFLLRITHAERKFVLGQYTHFVQVLLDDCCVGIVWGNFPEINRLSF